MNCDSIVGPSDETAVRLVYIGRDSKVFSVFESELHAMLSMSNQAAFFSSWGSALLSYAVGIWTNALFSAELTSRAAILTTEVAPILAVLSAIFFGLFFGVHLKHRHSIQKQLSPRSVQ